MGGWPADIIYSHPSFRREAAFQFVVLTYLRRRIGGCSVKRKETNPKILNRSVSVGPRLESSSAEMKTTKLEFATHHSHS